MPLAGLAETRCRFALFCCPEPWRLILRLLVCEAMNIALYREKRAREALQEPRRRLLCQRCLQPDFSCYCHLVRPFDPGIEFVILIHPIEVHRRIATGRMAHLCLKRSHLVMGEDYSNNPTVNAIVEDPNRHCVILYPGGENLSQKPPEERRAPENLTVFVIDGTWGTARKMIRLSQNLARLPRICFTPTTPSRFRVRKQPRPECYSTIEAIHATIGLMKPGQDHDHLLYVFDRMVDRQIELAHGLDAKSRPFNP